MAPEIENRQETLRIRRILSIYLSQNMEGSLLLSATTLGVPGDDTRVRRIPREIFGLRKRYLKALQAHVKAKEGYERVLQGPYGASLGKIRQEKHEVEHEASTSVTSYLDLLLAQRKYQKLRILQDYLDLLAQKDAARPEYLSIASILEDMAPPPELSSTASGGGSIHGVVESQNNNTRALILRLEKEVLRAQNSLEKEKRLLAQVKSEHQSEFSPEDSKSFETSAQILALSQTRDELVSWIEQRLAQGDQAENKSDKVSDRNEVRIPLDIDERKEAIDAKYEDYLHARKSLLALASSRKAPALQKPNAREYSKPHQQSESRETSLPEASVILPYLTEHLLPASNAQKVFLQQESHLSKTLADQNHATTKALDKLAEESHLLRTYPLLAALRSKPLSGDASNATEAQTMTHARAWAFAASAARAAKHDEVRERLEHAETGLDKARGRIVELKEILGGDADEDGEEKEEDDMWTESAGKKSGGGLMKKRWSGDRGGLGIWAGLDGNVKLP